MNVIRLAKSPFLFFSFLFFFPFSMCVVKAAVRTSRRRRLTAKAKGGRCCPLESRRVLGIMACDLVLAAL